MANHYTNEQKAAILQRLILGETYVVVAQDSGVPIGTLKSWMDRQRNQMTVVATAPLDMQLKEQLGVKIATFLMEGMETLTDHAKLYRTPAWRDQQTPETLLAVDRSLGSNVRSILDRLTRRDGDGDSTED